MLRTGEIDICYKPLPSNVAALKAHPDVTVDMPLDTRTIFMGLNCQKGVTKDKRVRQALNYAIDKKPLSNGSFSTRLSPWTVRYLPWYSDTPKWITSMTTIRKKPNSF